MRNNKDFLNSIFSNKSRFYLFDFHVHSPASFDVRTGEHFNKLSQSERTRIETIPENMSKKLIDYEKEVLKAFPVDQYYQLLVKHRDTIAKSEMISEGEDWALIAITDHNVCKYASELSKYSWNNELLKENRIIIFPGIELDVCFMERITKSPTTVHIILVYAPGTESHQIYSAIRESNNQKWEFGQTITVDDLPSFISKIRVHNEYPAISIAAHVGSSKGLKEETKKCYLNYLDAAILRVQGQIDDCCNMKEKTDLSNLLKNLESDKNRKNGKTHEILNLLGHCGFDALQVRGKKDEPYYRQLHRYKKELGRAVAIVCSDAHRLEDIFICRNHSEHEETLSFIKLKDLSPSMNEKQVFEQIRDKGLRYGETRVSFVKPKQVSYWIEGIEIMKDANEASRFWTSMNTNENTNVDLTQDIQSCVLPFSRNLNCLIGGRGSGKSAAIEAISFLINSKEFLEAANRDKDWYKRAKSTLQGCKIRICLRLLEEHDLPKKVIFISNYFDPNNKHRSANFSNINDQDVLPSLLKLPRVDIFRIHDIEESSKPERLREIFDSICGNDVDKISSEIAVLVEEMKKQRSEIVGIAKSIIDITKDASALREYARRKKEFLKVDKPEIKSQFEKIDQCNSALSIIEVAGNDWEAIIEKINIDNVKKDIEKFLEKLKEGMYEPNCDPKKLKPFCEELMKLLPKFERDESESSTDNKTICEILDITKRYMQSVMDDISNAKLLVEDSNRDYREELANQGIPQGSEDRQTKKEHFEESQKALNDYREFLKQFDKLCQEREAKCVALKYKVSERSEIRKITAEKITKMLQRNLDKTVLQIEADAQPLADKKQFRIWLDQKFDWTGCKYKEARIQSLLEEDRATPYEFKKVLFSKTEPFISVMVVNRANAATGRITEDDVRNLIENNTAWIKLEPEILVGPDNQEFYNELPEEIRTGIYTFNSKNSKENIPLLNSVLELDEIVYDDIPSVRLNDRPYETEVMKELSKLSPGQRCSALLPILLLTGNGPLIIDQPEDNLDNRLIRQVIVNVLAGIKLQRQVIIATHNANLPVLGDAEQVIALRAVEDECSALDAMGSLDDPNVVRNITEIMEGGREAFQYRQTIYQTYWNDGADQA